MRSAIGGDFLLIYRLEGKTIIFAPVGTHSDLFTAWIGQPFSPRPAKLDRIERPLLALVQA
jgi:hypothetical protein